MSELYGNVLPENCTFQVANNRAKGTAQSGWSIEVDFNLEKTEKKYISVREVYFLLNTKHCGHTHTEKKKTRG